MTEPGRARRAADAPRVATGGRRRALRQAGALAAVTLLPGVLRAQDLAPPLRAAMQGFLAGATARPGRVSIEIAELVENGNAVPVTLRVQSPMTAADHVSAIALFTERNPQPDVAWFHLGPRNGRAEVGTRIRLATSQKLIALARLSDGSCWSAAVDVVVTIAACIEGEG